MSPLARILLQLAIVQLCALTIYSAVIRPSAGPGKYRVRRAAYPDPSFLRDHFSLSKVPRRPTAESIEVVPDPSNVDALSEVWRSRGCEYKCRLKCTTYCVQSCLSIC
ncbi:hypothetical protein CRM22_008379 [Opisthorchis felineus]|uniref:WAP domain-containing protein n=1 Tax=Opisthorchis felineus TaxID=147828 RepID=A0A4S2LJD4_OPIFE|nr:hypothetical protein CRM22_008379 [Opisthorchis felineus]